jgi:cellobiose epimerase
MQAGVSLIMNRLWLYLLVLTVLEGCTTTAPQDAKQRVLSEMEFSMKEELLDVWYPRSFDQEYGGFLSTFTYDFKPEGEQDKMIVSQARHLWTNSKAALIYPDVKTYRDGAALGFKFLRDVMWDQSYGGFYTLVDRQGNVKGGDEKTAYGNAFGIYALAAHYATSKDTAALQLAQKAFRWLEKNSHDPVHKGYFQHLTRTGTPILRSPSTDSKFETGYKDQNSSIHLLEAFTELYHVWPDSLLRARLQEMLVLIRDTIVQPKGYMVLFFHPDWTPVSYRDSSQEVSREHFSLDHVSFGHDVETAFLMLEASHVLGISNDSITLKVSKKMVDHALENGWDKEVGGFYDGGYYFNGHMGITIVQDSKNWWSQAEGLNTLLMMAELFPKDDHNYVDKFIQLWNYTNQYVIDHEHGEWYPGGLDKEPDQKTALKGHIWKASYHQFRSLMNCVERLKNDTKHNAG